MKKKTPLAYWQIAHWWSRVFEICSTWQINVSLEECKHRQIAQKHVVVVDETVMMANYTDINLIRANLLHLITWKSHEAMIRSYSNPAAVRRMFATLNLIIPTLRQEMTGEKKRSSLGKMNEYMLATDMILCSRIHRVSPPNRRSNIFFLFAFIINRVASTTAANISNSIAENTDGNLIPWCMAMRVLK